MAQRSQDKKQNMLSHQDPEQHRLIHEEDKHLFDHLAEEDVVFWLEAIATFIFIYSSACYKENTGPDLHFFAGILVAVSLSARHCGANVNPAVSCSQFQKNGSDWTYSILWVYIKAQLIGAIIAIAMAYIFNDVYISPVHLSEPTAGAALQVIISEAVGVFILIFLILYATGPVSFIDSEAARYFYISVFVHIGRRFAASSANQINVALTLSRAIIGIPHCDFQGFRHILFWIIGDALGVLIACAFYNQVVEPTVKIIRRKKLLKEEEEHHSQEMKQMKNVRHT